MTSTSRQQPMNSRLPRTGSSQPASGYTVTVAATSSSVATNAS
jgi:hypothetical protein